MPSPRSRLVLRAGALLALFAGAALAACASGSTSVGCRDGLSACDGACAALDLDPRNCGACGLACDDGEACVAGACTAAPKACSDGLVDCGGSCVDTTDDLANCGACGSPCGTAGGTASCKNGTCSIACDPGRADCDADPENGCEVDTATDPQHCGGCAAACGASGGTPSCKAGTCSIACDPGRADCDADPANGCEVDTMTDPQHCGSCATSCGNKACDGGSCPQFKFALVQTVDGVTVSCSAVGGDGTYTECTDLKAGGLSFPNGVSCNAGWSAQPSPYTDLAGFCASLTGVPLAQAYFDCGATSTRATWKNHVWGKTDDNGFVRHLRCLY